MSARLENAVILQVSPADTEGGAERVARELHEEYRRRSLDSWLAVGDRHGNDPRVLEIPNEARRSEWTRALADAAASLEPRGNAGRLVARVLQFAAYPARFARIARGAEDYDFPGTADLLGLTPNPPDVLHLHNLHGYYFDLRMLPDIAASQPTILTLHDAWPMTGHCAHPIDCERWRTGCGECPDLGRYVAIRADASAENRELKRDILTRTEFRLATPSRWLMRIAEESGVAALARETRVIANGTDTSVFVPGDKNAARVALGLPVDGTILLFAARGVTDNPFKDWPTLRSALRQLAARSSTTITLVALGADSAEELPGGADVRTIPFVSDSAEVARYYQAADVYVHAARAENLPLTIIEAMACGTPVVASSVGGIPELVTDDVNGTLVRPGDADALSAAVEALLGDVRRRRLYAEAGLALVKQQFTLERQADAYLEWYAELLG
ncbi:MAG: group 1 glycosyl transferase [Actinobacteria bacterium HGW-Actinobacteria-10]|nr:MAG: group 1 glycosyl transferase [Actinobacteria bacterium HGW-Actinobacteria-10]